MPCFIHMYVCIYGTNCVITYFIKQYFPPSSWQVVVITILSKIFTTKFFYVLYSILFLLRIHIRNGWYWYFGIYNYCEANYCNNWFSCVYAENCVHMSKTVNRCSYLNIVKLVMISAIITILHNYYFSQLLLIVKTAQYWLLEKEISRLIDKTS